MQRCPPHEHAAPTPGWYADPAGAPQWRYWDGAQWSAQTQSWFLDARSAAGQTLELERGVGLGASPTIFGSARGWWRG